VSTQRLSLTRNGRIRYQLKTPYNDGTTHVIFEPLDFIAKLVALVPKPRVNLTRYHGIFAPNSVHLHRNLNQKQHIFALKIAPATVVKLSVSITSSRIR
jgi:hypothetical protein